MDRIIKDQEKVNFNYNSKNYIIEVVAYSDETTKFSLWDVTQPELTHLVFNRTYDINTQDENTIKQDMTLAGYGELYEVIDDISI